MTLPELRRSLFFYHHDHPRNIKCLLCHREPGEQGVRWFKELYHDKMNYYSRWLCGKCYDSLPNDGTTDVNYVDPDETDNNQTVLEWD